MKKTFFFTAVVPAVFCTLLWGTAFPFIKLGYAAFEVAEGDIGAKLLFAGLRFFIAGLMVLAFLCVRERRFVLPESSERQQSLYFQKKRMLSYNYPKTRTDQESLCSKG